MSVSKVRDILLDMGCDDVEATMLTLQLDNVADEGKFDFKQFVDAAYPQSGSSMSLSYK